VQMANRKLTEVQGLIAAHKAAAPVAKLIAEAEELSEKAAKAGEPVTKAVEEWDMSLEDEALEKISEEVEAAVNTASEKIKEAQAGAVAVGPQFARYLGPARARLASMDKGNKDVAEAVRGFPVCKTLITQLQACLADGEAVTSKFAPILEELKTTKFTKTAEQLTALEPELKSAWEKGTTASAEAKKVIQSSAKERNQVPVSLQKKLNKFVADSLKTLEQACRPGFDPASIVKAYSVLQPIFASLDKLEKSVGALEPLVPEGTAKEITEKAEAYSEKCTAAQELIKESQAQLATIPVEVNRVPPAREALTAGRARLATSSRTLTQLKQPVDGMVKVAHVLELGAPLEGKVSENREGLTKLAALEPIEQEKACAAWQEMAAKGLAECKEVVASGKAALAFLKSEVGKKAYGEDTEGKVSTLITTAEEGVKLFNTGIPKAKALQYTASRQVETARMKATFEKYDKDGDGKLNSEELKAYAKGEGEVDLAEGDLSTLIRSSGGLTEDFVPLEHSERLSKALRTVVIQIKQRKEKERLAEEKAKKVKEHTEFVAKVKEVGEVLVKKAEEATVVADGVAEEVKALIAVMGSKDITDELKSALAAAEAKLPETTKAAKEFADAIQTAISSLPETENPLSKNAQNLELKPKEAKANAVKKKIEQLGGVVATAKAKIAMTGAVEGVETKVEALHAKAQECNSQTAEGVLKEVQELREAVAESIKKCQVQSREAKEATGGIDSKAFAELMRRLTTSSRLVSKAMMAANLGKKKDPA